MLLLTCSVCLGQSFLYTIALNLTLSDPITNTESEMQKKRSVAIIHEGKTPNQTKRVNLSCLSAEAFTATVSTAKAMVERSLA